MSPAKRIFMVADIRNNPVRTFADQVTKIAKGFIRLGHDVRIFSYCTTLNEISPFKSKTISVLLYKTRADKILADQIKIYQPEVIYINFPRDLNAETIKTMRTAAPNAVFMGVDGDPWPKLQGNRIETARELDIVMATNDGRFLQDYRDAGVPKCIFMPNLCDPDIDHRYEIEEKWKTDILWIGKLHHHADKSEVFRDKLIKELASRPNCTLYGCCGRPSIGGMDCLYAMSGARIGVNVNAYSPVKFCHSDRLTRYMACGTFVMARRFTGAESLYKDGEHIIYFNEISEFFELAGWFLKHEDQRKKIADAGMKWIHEQYNCVKIAGYVLDVAEKGFYKAPWSD